MTLSGKVVIAAAPERVWHFLLDPRQMRECLPYCDSLEQVGEDAFRSVVKMKVSVIEANFTLKTTITDKRPFESLRMVTEGEDRRLASLVKQENLIELAPAPGASTELSYRTEVTVTGRIAKLGLSILTTKARQIAEEFAQSLKARIEKAESAPASEIPKAST